MAFKDRLRQLREEHDLSQQELGNVLHVSKANVSKFETGKLQPSLQHLIALAQYFAVPADYLLDISNQRSSGPSKSAPPPPAPPPITSVPVNFTAEQDPFKLKIAALLTNEYTEIEKDILSRCLTYG